MRTRTRLMERELKIKKTKPLPKFEDDILEKDYRKVCQLSKYLIISAIVCEQRALNFSLNWPIIKLHYDSVCFEPYFYSIHS